MISKKKISLTNCILSLASSQKNNGVRECTNISTITCSNLEYRNNSWVIFLQLKKIICFVTCTSAGNVTKQNQSAQKGKKKSWPCHDTCVGSFSAFASSLLIIGHVQCRDASYLSLSRCCACEQNCSSAFASHEI